MFVSNAKKPKKEGKSNQGLLVHISLLIATFNTHLDEGKCLDVTRSHCEAY